MVIKIYLIAGVIFEAFVIKDYVKDKVPYTKAQIIIGGIIDVVLWPIILLENFIDWRR